jgi:hypothetical protein
MKIVSVRSHQEVVEEHPQEETLRTILSFLMGRLVSLLQKNMQFVMQKKRNEPSSIQISKSKKPT